MGTRLQRECRLAFILSATMLAFEGMVYSDFIEILQKNIVNPIVIPKKNLSVMKIYASRNMQRPFGIVIRG